MEEPVRRPFNAGGWGREEAVNWNSVSGDELAEAGGTPDFKDR